MHVSITELKTGEDEMAEAIVFPISLATEIRDRCRAYAQTGFDDWVQRNASYLLVDDDTLESRAQVPDYDDLFEWARREYTGKRRATHISQQGWHFPNYAEDIREFCHQEVTEFLSAGLDPDDWNDVLNEHVGDIEVLVDECYVEAIDSI